MIQERTLLIDLAHSMLRGPRDEVREALRRESRGSSGDVSSIGFPPILVLLFGSLDVYEDVWACFPLEVPTVRSHHQESIKFTFGPKSQEAEPCCKRFWFEAVLSNSGQIFAAYGVYNGALYGAREQKAGFDVNCTRSSEGNSTRRRSTANLREREFAGAFAT